MISVERGLSEKTLEAYHNDIDDLFRFLKNKVSVSDIDERLLHKYIKSLGKKKLTKSSIARKKYYTTRNQIYFSTTKNKNILNI